MIPALVLTAGLATRLRPLSLVRAKAALPVAGEPLVHRILRQLSQAGVSTAVLNLHHLPHTITRIVGDGDGLGIRVRYSWENPVLGSAGGPRRAAPLLAGATNAAAPDFFIVNGDTLAGVDLRALASAHHDSGALVTMAVVSNREPGKYGGIVAGDDDAMRGYAKRGATVPSYHFVGVQVADPAAFASVPENVPYESVGQLYQSLVAERPGSVRVFRCAADFYDIGTPADYLETSMLLASRNDGSLTPGEGAVIDRDASIERSILWDRVVVEAGASLRECIVTDGVRVPAGTTWTRVSMRVADGALTASETQAGELAVSPI